MDVREKLVALVHNARMNALWHNAQKTDEYITDMLMEEGVTVQDWTSVNDRFPEDNERVIAYRPNEPETSAYKYCVMWGWSVKSSLKHRGITHWMPLPQPPKGE